MCATRLVFADSAKILSVVGEPAIDRMTENYGMIPEVFRHMPNPRLGIDWRRIADEYDAVIISPYVWTRRLHGSSEWYYPWDCASGCVWRAAAVAALEPVDPPIFVKALA